MTVRAIVGLIALNVGFLIVGAALLWGLRGWRYWTDLIRFGGLAYLLGIAAMAVVLTWEVVLGVPFSLTSMAVSAAALVAVGITVGRVRRRHRPRPAPVGWRLHAPSLFVAAMTAGIILWAEASFRAARLQPPWLIDSWRVWTSRAKSLFFDGDLGGVAVLGGGDGFLTSYPPALSLVQAQAFEAMGRADAITLHVQHWFFALGFLAAIFGLLARRVRAAILAPVVLLILVMPSFSDLAIWPLADPLLAYLVSVAAVLVCLWLEDGARWRLQSAALLLAAAVLVKREAVLVVACVFVAAAAVAWLRRRGAWRQVVGALLIAIVLSSPWRVWVFLSGGSDAPSQGLDAFLTSPGRGLDALQLVASSLVGARWGVPMLLVLAAGILSVIAGARSTPLFAASFVLASVCASAIVIWAEPALGISQNLSVNPVIRMALVVVVVTGPLTALMLEDAWTEPARSASGPTIEVRTRATSVRSWAAWCVVGFALLVYPISAVLGIGGPTLPGGRPVFPEPQSHVAAMQAKLGVVVSCPASTRAFPRC